MESNLRDKLIASFSSKAMVNLLRSTEKKVEEILLVLNQLRRRCSDLAPLLKH